MHIPKDTRRSIVAVLTALALMLALTGTAFADHDPPIDLGASGTENEQDFDCAGDYFKIENIEDLTDGEHDYVGTTKDGNPWSATLDWDEAGDSLTVVAMSPDYVSIFVKTGQQNFTETGPTVGPYEGQGLGISHVAFCLDGEPPETDPPATDPPATDPPATDPPATDPPATDPPVITPPPTSMSDGGTGSGNILPVLLAGLLAAGFLFLRPASRFSPVLRKR